MGQTKGQDVRTGSGVNEGEGSRSAARNYNRGQRAFVKSGKVERSARAAEKAMSGPERKDLREAEKAGERKARS